MKKRKRRRLITKKKLILNTRINVVNQLLPVNYHQLLQTTNVMNRFYGLNARYYINIWGDFDLCAK